jgi:hypothetical protein
MRTSSSWWSWPLLSCVVASAVAGQKPSVRVEFQVLSAAYTDTYRDAVLKFVSDSGAVLLAEVFNRRLGFLSYSAGATDTASGVLLVRLEEHRGARDSWDEVGLRLKLASPPTARDTLYWLQWRSKQGARAAVEEPEAFLALLRARLENAVDADWNRVVTGLLHQIPIADTNAAVWGPPAQWLIPYRPTDLCIDGETGRLKVQNVRQTEWGPEDTSVIVVPRATFDPQRLRAEDAAFERFRGFIRATPTHPVALARDSTQVKAVYVTEYHFDVVNCSPLRRASPEEGP